MNIKSLLSTAMAAFSAIALSQKAVAQLEKAEDNLSGIYKAYEALNYVSFDVAYTYTSDTLAGDFTSDKLNGFYKINGKEVLYKLGDMTFLQNDSVLIGVYETQHLILLGNPQSARGGSYLPMRAQMDSLFKTDGLHYKVQITSKAKLTTISFTGIDSLAQFSKYDIVYDNKANLLHTLRYTFNGMTDRDLEDPSISDSTRKRLLHQTRKKTLTIQFSNYQFDRPAGLSFNEEQFIVHHDKGYQPSATYRGYKIYDTRRR